MRIAIVGTGYVGLVSGACFAEMGTEVYGVDTNKEKIDKLCEGVMPIYEPGLEEMVLRNHSAGRLHFVTQLDDCIDRVEVIFCAVGTPPGADGRADLAAVLSVARQIGRLMTRHMLVVTKSTVPVGTSKLIRAAIQDELDRRGVSIEFDIASNPEFLKEGAAIKDFMSPDRVVVGVESDRARKLMSRLYRPFLLNNFRVIFMDIASAEMTKYAANAMLATRISFMNEIANLCEQVGADIHNVRKGIGSDRRIGTSFLYAGCGYGGSCFPKDIKALIGTGVEHGMRLRILEAVEAVNVKQKTVLVEKLMEQLGADLTNKKIAVWGLAFKPETDDMREASSLVIVDRLLAAGAEVSVYDPVANGEAKLELGERVRYANDMYDATIDADALMLVTEWKEFRLPSWSVVRKLMRKPLLLDGRNIYDMEELQEHGFEYRCIGK